MTGLDWILVDMFLLAFAITGAFDLYRAIRAYRQARARRT